MFDDTTPTRAIAAVEAAHGSNRTALKVLAGLMVGLIGLVLLILLGVTIEGASGGEDVPVLFALMAPLFAGSIWFYWWAARKTEAPLVAALSASPPTVLSAGYLEFRGRYGVRSGIEIKTADGHVWREMMPEALVHEVVAWVEASRSDTTRAQHSYRAADATQHSQQADLARWSSQAHLPGSCVYCAASTSTVHRHAHPLQGGVTMQMTLPICPSCKSRKTRRLIVAIVASIGAFIGGAAIATQLYPAGNQRALVGIGIAAVGWLALFVGYRLTKMSTVITEHRGGIAGEALFVRFGNATFDDAYRRANPS